MATHDDHTQITRRRYEYAFGIDTRDWALHRSIFTDEVTMDFTSYSGGDPRTVSADDWVDGLKPLFHGLDASQHTMTNPMVDVDGDRARCRMTMSAAHFLFEDPEPEFTIGGWYDDRLVKVDDTWLIEAVTLTVWWRRGNEAIMGKARELGLQRLGL